MSILFNLKDYLSKVANPTEWMQTNGICNCCYTRAFTRYKYEVHACNDATLLWIHSSAVHSNLSTLWPVASECSNLPDEVYRNARSSNSMLKGEYGQNRIQYAQFLHDYLEEYWK